MPQPKGGLIMEESVKDEIDQIIAYEECKEKVKEQLEEDPNYDGSSLEVKK
jgi:hypothetical protein